MFESARLQIVAGWIRHYGRRRVLDIGCGQGQLLLTLDPLVVDDYVGVDASRVATESARRRPDIPARFLVADIQSEDLPADLRTDCLCFVDVAYYLPLPAEVFARTLRHLASDGILIVCQWIHPDADAPHNHKAAAVFTAMEATGNGLLDDVALQSAMTGNTWRLKVIRPRAVPACS